MCSGHRAPHPPWGTGDSVRHSFLPAMREQQRKPRRGDALTNCFKCKIIFRVLYLLSSFSLLGGPGKWQFLEIFVAFDVSLWLRCSFTTLGQPWSQLGNGDLSILTLCFLPIPSRFFPPPCWLFLHLLSLLVLLQLWQLSELRPHFQRCLCMSAEFRDLAE